MNKVNITINDNNINVPSPTFPFITIYAKLINRITKKDITDYVSVYEINEFNMGDFYKSSYSQCLLRLKIINNETAVTAGQTFFTYKDATNCKIDILDNNMNIINDCVQFYNYDVYSSHSNFLIKGSNNKEGILSGLGEVAIVDVGLNLIENFPFPFINIQFSFIQDNITIPTNIKLNYNLINELYIDKTSNSNYLNFDLPVNSTIEIYNQNNVLMDIKNNNTTDILNYNSYLSNGIYNIVLKDNLNIRNYNNIQIDNNINKSIIINKGIIKTVYNNDVYNFYDLNENDIYYIYGNILDVYNYKANNIELVITQNNNLIVYTNINDGVVSFVLEPGIYDIKMRSNNIPVKIVNNFEFNPSDGFFNKLFQNISLNNNYDFSIS